MSGGPVSHPTPEAWAMRDLALSLGLAAARVEIEDRARNTIENALHTRPILAARGWRRVLVVTDAYHLPRALYVFRRLGVMAEGAGARPSRRRAEWVLAWLREVAALPWTVARVERRRRN